MIGNVHKLFELSGKIAVITGGVGLLGIKHAEALMEYGANCILLDINTSKLNEVQEILNNQYECEAMSLCCDITDKLQVQDMLDKVIKKYGKVDILINNAANNPKFEHIEGEISPLKRFESYPVEEWQKDLDVGLKGAFLCSQVVGSYMSEHGGGIIINIASDLGVIAPDQRIYKKEGMEENLQPTKPVTYSVVKTGLIGLTKYIATYWADKNVRCNALVPGGVYTGQSDDFLKKLSNLIPMGRMADENEYKAAIVFLCSDASSYMTGSSLMIEGGRTCW